MVMVRHATFNFSSAYQIMCFLFTMVFYLLLKKKPCAITNHSKNDKTTKNKRYLFSSMN